MAASRTSLEPVRRPLLWIPGLLPDTVAEDSPEKGAPTNDIPRPKTRGRSGARTAGGSGQER